MPQDFASVQSWRRIFGSRRLLEDDMSIFVVNIVPTIGLAPTGPICIWDQHFSSLAPGKVIFPDNFSDWWL